MAKVVRQSASFSSPFGSVVETKDTVDLSVSSTLKASDSALEAKGDVCNVCREGGVDEQNPLVVCVNCKINVHRECYGNPLNFQRPEDPWTCDRCENGAGTQSCALCPVKHGAMKRTTDWKWAHLSCALWIPEVFFRGAEGREPIDYLQIPAHRWGNECFHCGQTHGAVMSCSQGGCSRTFHITCGMEHNIFLEYKASKSGADVVVALCSEHSKRWHGRKKTR